MYNCNTIICSSSVTVGTGVVLIPNQPLKNLANMSTYGLIVACNINTPTANRAVYIQTPAGNAPLLCKYGNNITANMLNKRIRYTVNYGTQNTSYPNVGQFIIPSCECLNKRGNITTVALTNASSDKDE